MKAKSLTMIAILLIVGYSIVVSAQKSDQTLRVALGESQFHNCGLDKLNQHEIKQLMNLLVSRPLQSFTRESAKNYMIEENWRKVRVLGVIPPESRSGDDLVLVYDNYELFTIDPFSTEYLPEPGVHWAKNTLSSWTLLSVEGEEISYLAVKLE